MTSTDQPDTAIAAAFEELRREVSLTRAAIEGLTAARERIPDYSATLGQIAERLKATAATVDRIENAPAVSLSPDAMTAEIVKAASAARTADARLIQEARDAFSQSIGQVDSIVKRGQAVDRQWRQRVWTGAVCALAGALLWSFLPGVVARSLPTSWHVPEWMAARTMRMDRHQTAHWVVQQPRLRNAPLAQ
jgi:phage-related minor tail protein